jgi:hypothetical protein
VVCGTLSISHFGERRYHEVCVMDWIWLSKDSAGTSKKNNDRKNVCVPGEGSKTNIGAAASA